MGQDVVAHFELIAATGEEAACALANPVLLGTEREAPCVLLITSDAHRADHLSAAGLHGSIETPWIDVWTRRGTLFTNAWSSSNAPLASLEAHLHRPAVGLGGLGAAPGRGAARAALRRGWLDDRGGDLVAATSLPRRSRRCSVASSA